MPMRHIHSAFEFFSKKNEMRLSGLRRLEEEEKEGVSVACWRYA